MRSFLISIVVLFTATGIGWGQPILRHSIGVDALPQDSESICPLGVYSTDFINAGLYPGDTAFDFTLYDQSGKPTSLSEILASGKPVLLVSGSFTCPVFRNNIQTINSVVSSYGDVLNVYVIYTAEAHPVIDTSPFGDEFINVEQANEFDSVLYRQPKTYGARRSIERDLIRRRTINAPILIDGPCNQWFKTYGPAPNIAYLIDAQGIVRSKEPWLNIQGYSIDNDIHELLTNQRSDDAADTGIVTFELTTKDTIYTKPGKIVSLNGKLVNNSDAGAIIHLRRHNSSKMPEGWQTAICTNVCLSPEEDTSIVRVSAHSSQSVIVYFYVGETLGTGRVYLHFYNDKVPSDSSTTRLVCIATPTEGFPVASSSAQQAVTIVPNPTTGVWSIRSAPQYSTIRIYDMLGRVVSEMPQASEYFSQNSPRGVYRLQLLSASKSVLAESTLIRQ
ncbi:MAG: redoxin domain-containing protein [Bacteroidota bacterium]|nr:redoxin domain-containing protein [Bacteroidota bacterium]